MNKSPGTADRSRPAPSHALDALERAMAGDLAARPLLRLGGTVTEISSSACRLAGLSHVVRLGDCVEIARGDKAALCEVVRIDAHGVTVKPFDGALEAGLGTLAWARGGVTLSPHTSWKGRTLNALGEPIDGLGPLRQGERALPTNREPPRPCAGSGCARR